MVLIQYQLDVQYLRSIDLNDGVAGTTIKPSDTEMNMLKIKEETEVSVLSYPQIIQSSRMVIYAIFRLFGNYLEHIEFETHRVIPHFRMLLGSIPGPPPCPGPHLRSTTSRNPHEARGVSNVLYPSYGYLFNGRNEEKPWILGFFRRPHWGTMIQDLKLYTALLRNMKPWIEQP